MIRLVAGNDAEESALDGAFIMTRNQMGPLMTKGMMRNGKTDKDKDDKYPKPPKKKSRKR